MGGKIKTFGAIFGALVLLNFARPKLEGMAWFPAALKRADGLGLDDAFDAVTILAVLWAANKYL